MQAALSMLGPDGFARAYGNRWVSTATRVIPLAAWRAGGRGTGRAARAGNGGRGFRRGRRSFRRGDRGRLARPGRRRSRRGRSSRRPGVGWLAERLLELRDRWRPVVIAYDAAGPALDVADVAERAGIELAGLKAREYAAACAGLLDALVAEPGRLRYRPHPALDAAAAGAARRTLGDAWAWGRRQSAGSLSALTAATVAVWAFDHAPEALGEFRIL